MFTRYFRKVNPADAWQARDTIGHFSFPQGVPARLSLPLPQPVPGQTAQDYLVSLGLPPSNWPINVHRLAIDSEPLYNQPAANVLATLEKCLRISADPSLFEPVPLPDPDNPANNKGDYRGHSSHDGRAQRCGGGDRDRRRHLPRPALCHGGARRRAPERRDRL